MRPGNSQIPPAALAGAVDLSSLKRPPAGATPAAGEGAAPKDNVIDVTEATFTAEVLERRCRCPLSWTSGLSGAAPASSSHRSWRSSLLRAAGPGFWPRSMSTQTNALPRPRACKHPGCQAVVDGQIVGEFTGAIPEKQLRQWITALLEAAVQARAESGGANGTVNPDAEAAEAPAEVEQTDPRILAAEDALQRGDADAAEAALRTVLAEQPGHPQATAALAQVELFRRVSDIPDLDSAIAAADAHSDDIDAQLLAADVELLSGLVEPAFARLIDVVRRTEGAQRDAARSRLLSLFALLPQDDPRVARARRDLTAALF